MLLSGNRPHAIPDIIFASQTGSSKIPVRTGLLKTRRTDAWDDPLIGDLVQHEQLTLTDLISILAAMKKVKNFVAESVPVISAKDHLKLVDAIGGNTARRIRQYLNLHRSKNALFGGGVNLRGSDGETVLGQLLDQGLFGVAVGEKKPQRTPGSKLTRLALNA